MIIVCSRCDSYLDIDSCDVDVNYDLEIKVGLCSECQSEFEDEINQYKEKVEELEDDLRRAKNDIEEARDEGHEDGYNEGLLAGKA